MCFLALNFCGAVIILFLSFLGVQDLEEVICVSGGLGPKFWFVHAYFFQVVLLHASHEFSLAVWVFYRFACLRSFLVSSFQGNAHKYYDQIVGLVYLQISGLFFAPIVYVTVVSKLFIMFPRR